MLELTAGNEVLELAIRMEEAARDFYEALGGASDDPKVAEFCLAARREEAKHQAIFQDMRREWSLSHQAHLMSPEALEALQTMARERTHPDPAAVQQVALKGNLASALELALGMERGAIRFYEDMRAHMPNVAEALDEVLRQERMHVERLMALGRATAGVR